MPSSTLPPAARLDGGRAHGAPDERPSLGGPRPKRPQADRADNWHSPKSLVGLAADNALSEAETVGEDWPVPDPDNLTAAAAAFQRAVRWLAPPR